jgi:hypothetical protein
MNVDSFRKRDYNQSDYLNAIEFLSGREVKLKGGGVCAQLACKWLQMKLKELAGGDKTTTDSRIEKLREFDTFGKAIERHQTGSINPAVEYKLKMKNIVYQPTRALVAVSVAGHKHACHLLVFSCPKYPNPDQTPGVHSIALYRSGGKLGLGTHVYCFDPDEGEYKIPTNQFAAWLNQFLQERYGTNQDSLITSLEELQLK